MGRCRGEGPFPPLLLCSKIYSSSEGQAFLHCSLYPFSQRARLPLIHALFFRETLTQVYATPVPGKVPGTDGTQ